MFDNIVLVVYDDQIVMIETDLTYEQLQEKIEKYAVKDEDGEIDLYETLKELENNGYVKVYEYEDDIKIWDYSHSSI